jgi:hypothetical protein
MKCWASSLGRCLFQRFNSPEPAPVPGYRDRREDHGLPIVRDEFQPPISIRLRRTSVRWRGSAFFDRIAAKLNEERIPTCSGPWHGVVINRILTGKR